MLLLLIIKAGYELLNKEDDIIDNQDDSEMERRIREIQDSTVLIKSIQESLNKFSLPMDRLNAYLAGGTKGAGNFGEWQLQAMIPNILPPELYIENCEIGEGQVEFAITLDNGLLPIDSKFPSQKFKDYQDASQSRLDEKTGEYKKVDKELTKKTKNKFITAIKNSANDIEVKYIKPPKTLEFAILAIPTESMMQLVDSCFAENGEPLKQYILRENKVMIMGPSVLASYLTVHLLMVERVTLNENTQNLAGKIATLKTNIKDISKTLTTALKHKKNLSTSLTALVSKIEETEYEIESTDEKDN